MFMDKQPCVYLLANKRNGSFYVGVTSNLVKRVWEHKSHLVEGFTKKYNVTLLVWYELHSTMESAIHKEKLLKNWKRSWKIKEIEKVNSKWNDLYDSII